MKILGAVLELPAKQHCQSSPFTSKLGQISQIGSAIFIFLIVLGAEYLFYVKSIETHARAFLTINIPSIGTVYWINQYLHIYNSKKSIIYSLAFCPFSAKNSILRIYLLAFLEEQKAWW